MKCKECGCRIENGVLCDSCAEKHSTFMNVEDNRVVKSEGSNPYGFDQKNLQEMADKEYSRQVELKKEKA